MATPSNQVGFAFQGDVIAGASLIHAAGGRLLKAFSDGGVDIYAVNGAIWLGASIPIQTSHERTVYQKLKSRGWKTSFFNKALRIGWGHSEIAIQMATTRSGTAALLLIGALATGGSYYDAAEAFSALLSVTGCPNAELPNVDVLKTMIEYLAPFTADCGFLSVFQQITATVNVAMSQPDGIVHVQHGGIRGDSEWANGLRQLCYSAERCENVFLYANDAAPWLAAFASYVLGMATKLVDRDTTLWQSAGTRGSVVVSMSVASQKMHEDSVRAKIGICIIEIPFSGVTSRIEESYPLSDALEIELSFYPQINSNLKNLICHDIVHYCLVIRDSSRFTGDVWNSQFRGHWTRYIMRPAALANVFEQLGISPHVRNAGSMMSGPRETLDRPEIGLDLWRESLVPGFLARSEVKRLCRVHRAGDSTVSTHVPCLCADISRLIWGFSRAICVLTLCNFNAKELSVQRVHINGSSHLFTDPSLSSGKITFSISTLLVDLAEMFFLHSPHGHWRGVVEGLLALSSDNTTIYCTPILEEDCFDSEGRVINIVSGRLAFNGVLRGFAESDDSCMPVSIWGPSATTYQVAPGTSIQRHYIENDKNVRIIAILLEQSISVACREAGSPGDISLAECIDRLLETMIAPPCRHDITRPHVLLDGEAHSTWVSGFMGQSKKGITLFALKDCKLEQLIQLAYLGDAQQKEATLLQFSCLTCAWEQAQELLQNGYGKVNIIVV